MKPRLSKFLSQGALALAAGIALLSPIKAKGADPWEQAYAAKEQLLLGNFKSAEKLLRSIQEELVQKDKDDLDWDLFRWADEELTKAKNQKERGEPALQGAVSLNQIPAPERAWYKSNWMWIGGGALLSVWIHHEIRKSQKRGDHKTQGFEP